MAKDPTPKADGLRAMREARYGSIQATSLNPTPNEAALLALMPKKMVPYAGKAMGDGNSGKVKEPVDKSPEAVAARKAVAAKRKKRKRKAP